MATGPGATVRARRPVGLGWWWTSTSPLEPLESVQEEIQRELELELIVATLTHARLLIVGHRRG